ncbi:MAG: hypothetical protein KDA80_10040 [Planctomycetaceae bacterium]|nr:hypothetical protein [Planctomycetaceae bacterium]
MEPQTFEVARFANDGTVVGTVDASDPDLVQNVRLEFGADFSSLPALELVEFDDGSMDGVANAIYRDTANSLNYADIFRLFRGNSDILELYGRIEFIEIQTNQQGQSTAILTFEFGENLAGEPAFGNEIYAATGFTELITATTGELMDQGAVTGHPDSTLYTSPGVAIFPDGSNSTTMNFDLELVATERSPTLRRFESIDPNDAPFTKIDFGRLQITDVTNLPDTSLFLGLIEEPITFEVTGGTGLGIFDVNRYSGDIRVLDSGALNGSTPSYTLDVTVTDKGVPRLSETATMTIDIAAPDPGILYFDASTRKFGLGSNTGSSFSWFISNAQVSTEAFLGDFDGDGDLDAGVYNPATSRVTVLTNKNGTLVNDLNGSATPEVRGTLSAGAAITRILGTADIDGNGIDELLYQRPHPGAGTAVPAGTQQIYVLGIGNDATPMDPLDANPLRFERQLATTDMSTSAAQFDFGDFNGDGLADLVFLTEQTMGTGTNLLPFYSFNSGQSLKGVLSSGTFGIQGLSGLQVDDLNNDGRDDLAVITTSGQILHATTTGAARAEVTGAHNFAISSRAPKLNSSSFSGDFAFGSFNNDALPDLFAFADFGNVFISVASLNGALENPVEFGSLISRTFGSTVTQRVVEDFNQDGFDDIAYLSSSAWVFFGNGTGFLRQNFGAIPSGGPGNITVIGTTV